MTLQAATAVRIRTLANNFLTIIVLLARGKAPDGATGSGGTIGVLHHFNIQKVAAAPPDNEIDAGTMGSW